MIRGTIVKGIAGFYYVKTENKVYECKAKGLFKKDNIIPYVGDEVFISLSESEDDGGTVIREILPRKNVFIRPPVSNVDKMIIIMALKNPSPNFLILDKFLVMAEKNNAESIICFNKEDICSDNEIDRILDIYKESGYPVVVISAKEKTGIDQLKPLLSGYRSALAGPSGSGKSTLLNSLQETVVVETGMISKKTKRGKHTTRHVELFETDFGAMIFDTPGFTSFDILEVEEDELEFLYPEFSGYLEKCKYNTCRHVNEPDCAVKKAVEEGLIHESRYKSYVLQYDEIKERERRKYQ